MNTKLPFSLDVLFLLLLVPAHTQLSGKAFLLVVPLLATIVLELWHPLTSYSSLPNVYNRTRLSFLLRFVLMLIMIASASIVPALENIALRLSLAADESGFSEAYAHMHDGAVQTESALEYLSQGKNPYVEKYDDTPLRYYTFSGISIPSNPAYDHFVYLPGFLITSWPVYLLFTELGLFYDQRLIYLMAYTLLILLLPLMVEAPAQKLLLLAAVGLNPLLVGPVIIGMNDVVVILALVVAALALIKKHCLLSALFLGVACIHKQSAWFVVPFYMLLLWRMVPSAYRLREMTKMLVVGALVTVLSFGPFLIWDASAFFQDVFAYPGGAVDVNYPIRGYTLGTMLVGMKLVESPLVSFPFWSLQLLLGVPFLAALLKYQWRRNDIGAMFLCAGVFIFGIGFLSRFFQDNYVGFVTVLITLGGILSLSEEEGVKGSPSMLSTSFATTNQRQVAAEVGEDAKEESSHKLDEGNLFL